jgi:hypothetical protein
MSPLFGGHHQDAEDGQVTSSGDPPRLIDMGPALDDAVTAAAQMPLPKIAAKLMSELFGSSYTPGEGQVDSDTLASPLIPDHSPAKYGDPTPPAVEILWDIAAEATQLLEHAGLIVPCSWYSGNVACYGYKSTRAGRTAVEQGTVERLTAALLN